MSKNKNDKSSNKLSELHKGEKTMGRVKKKDKIYLYSLFEFLLYV